MAVDERALAQDERVTRHRPAHARSTDTVAVASIASTEITPGLAKSAFSTELGVLPPAGTTVNWFVRPRSPNTPASAMLR